MIAEPLSAGAVHAASRWVSPAVSVGRVVWSGGARASIAARVTVTVYVFVVAPLAAVTGAVMACDPSARLTVRLAPALLPSASAMTTAAPASLGVAVATVLDTPCGTSAA